jgi:hypothetical protein
MELSRALRDYARTIPGKSQLFINAYAKALEVIPRQLCDNAGGGGGGVGPAGWGEQWAGRWQRWVGATHTRLAVAPTHGERAPAQRQPCASWRAWAAPHPCGLLRGWRCAGFDATDVLNKLRQKHALPGSDGKVRDAAAPACGLPGGWGLHAQAQGAGRAGGGLAGGPTDRPCSPGGEGRAATQGGAVGA